MTTPTIANLEKLIGGPRDGALVRYALGNEWLKAGDPIRAIESLRAAVAFDAQYSAAWKQLGKALESAGQTEEALKAFRRCAGGARDGGVRQAFMPTNRKSARHDGRIRTQCAYFFPVRLTGDASIPIVFRRTRANSASARVRKGPTSTRASSATGMPSCASRS